jgi:FtsH-binding integral membrane protein
VTAIMLKAFVWFFIASAAFMFAVAWCGLLYLTWMTAVETVEHIIRNWGQP